MRRGHASPYGNDDKLDFSTLKKLLPFLFEFRRRIFTALVFLILAKLASVLLPIILKEIVDTLNLGHTEGLGSSENPTKVENGGQTGLELSSPVLVFPLAMLLAYGLARFSTVLFGEIRDTLFGRVTERAMRRIALKVFVHLHRLDIAYHLERQTGGLSRDIERGTSGISFLLRFMVFNIVPTLLEIGFIVVLLLWNYSAWFGIIVLAAVVVYVSFSVLATEWRTRFVREANQADSTSNTRAIDSLLNYETVKYFNREEYEAELYDRELEKWEAARRKNRLSLFALNSGQALIIATALTAMMVLAGYSVHLGEMSIGDFVLINAYMMQIFLPLNFLGFVYREMKGALANIERLFYLLNLKIAAHDREGAEDLKVGSGEIVFKDVNFSYQEDGRKILQKLSFKAAAGQRTAIVGASGSGKSTIARLLYRFYESQAGSITIDDQNIVDVQLDSLRKVIGIVPQEAVLFNTTLRENLLYGSDKADTEALKEVLKLAYLDDFVSRLPDGLETMVGERGLKLSGGEKQRVSIARTLLKKPRIWIFDEATSSLDSAAEKTIVEAIANVTLGCTSLVIAHRLSTIVNADNILVIDDGVVVEQGTHDELYELQGVYRRLWDLQKQNRKDDVGGA